jgi:hypothetical protein
MNWRPSARMCSRRMCSTPSSISTTARRYDGSTIDTNQNIYTRPDGSQYDSVTGAPYLDPLNIVQLANGAYLNTQSNVMTLPDGTQIDMITGLNVNQLNLPDDGNNDGVDVTA